jgi:hypothetical protein
MAIKFQAILAMFFLLMGMLYFTATDAAWAGRQGQDVFGVVSPTD